MKIQNPRGAGRKPLPADKKRIKVWVSLPPELAVTDSKEIEAALKLLREIT